MMTREEAIEILWDMLPGPIVPPVHPGSQKQEAIRVALTAMCGPTREMVERMFPGCRYCKEGIYSDFAYDKMCRSEDGIYCKFCGKPMTDEAVDMMLKRMEEMTNEH